MARLDRSIGVSLDMHGCPNRCRHCGIGLPPNGRMMDDDLRWVAAEFRRFVRPGEDRPFFDNVRVSSWMREPDYSHEYRRLYDLEKELSDGPPPRWELLSIWRLARDPGYASWAKSVGPDTCQVTFFGVGPTQDWFCRRRGAFDDSILASERLLEAGMKPRWQLFLTTKILPELGELMKLIEQMRLRDRVAALGEEFDVFIHAPGLIGEGRHLTDLSVTLGQTRDIPAELVESTRRHSKTQKIWTTEAETVARAIGRQDESFVPYAKPPETWFLITCNWDVYPNIGLVEPWWRLGNLKTDGLAKIIDNYENDRILPLQINRPAMMPELARRYGNPSSQLVLNGLEEHWAELYCQEETHQAGR